MRKKLDQPDLTADEGVIKKRQKYLISKKKENNPNKPEKWTFPENLPASDYVTIDEKKFKKNMFKSNKKTVAKEN